MTYNTTMTDIGKCRIGALSLGQPLRPSARTRFKVRQFMEAEKEAPSKWGRVSGESLGSLREVSGERPRESLWGVLGSWKPLAPSVMFNNALHVLRSRSE